MYVLTVARRYLYTRPMSWVASIIIILIVMLYLVIISVMEGFKQNYMVKLRSVMAHMTVQVGNVPWGIVKPKQWAEKIKAVEGIKGLTISTETPCISIFDDGRTVGSLKGIDLDEELKQGQLLSILKPKTIKEFGTHQVGSKKWAGCIVGGAWRRSFGLKEGDLATFMFTNEDADPRAIQFKIIGFFEGDNDYLERGAYVDRELLAQEMKMAGTAKSFSLWVEGDPDRPDLDEIRDRVKAVMTETMKNDPYVKSQNAFDPSQKPMEVMLAVETWREKDANFYWAITRENQIMRFIMTIFLVFAAIIVFLILSRIVAEKIRDIGAMRAMGATPAGIRNCFMAQGLIIAGAGLVVALPLAVLMVTYLNEIEQGVRWSLMSLFGIEFRVLPSSWFLIDRIPTDLNMGDIALISALTLSSCFLGAFIPAWRASRLNPVECLRHE